MLRNIILTTTLLLGLSIQAQNHIDALRYSQESLWGSARYVAMGGAFGSLGANATSTSHNPAGIATHTTNEFSGSLNFIDIENQSTYHSSNAFDKKSVLSIPNLNYISANVFDPEQFGDLNRFNFGIGYNKLDDYNQNIYVSAEQNEHSFSDLMLNNAQGTAYDNLDVFREKLAFSTYLIDTTGGVSSYYAPVNGLMDKKQAFSSQRSGSKNEFYISFGTAYQNKLFLGATIGFPSIEYKEVSTISESNFNENSQEVVSLRSFDYNTNLYVSGSGINLKLGLIYKLDDNIRYGFALHTPTYYELHEEYSASMSTNFIDEDELINSESYLGIFDYGLNTPFKMINSLSFIINKRAIVSVDYEYLNYSTANIVSDFTDFSEANNSIKDYYTSTSNLKLGGELRIHPQLSLRAGYAYYGSPFAGSYNDASKEYLTMGMGLKVNQYFFDLALVNSVSKENYSIYDGASAATINTEKSQLLLSAGFKF
jgi:long-subunit fatty acid transport protein